MHPRISRALHRVPAPARPTAELLARTVVDVFDDRVPGLAAEIAFYLMLSVPPLLLTVIGLADVVGSASATEGLRGGLLAIMRQVVSSQTYESVVQPTIAEIFADSRASIASFGVIATLWSGSRALNVLIAAITIAYDLEEHRQSGWRRRLIAFGLTVVGILGAAVLLPLLVLGPEVVASVLDTVADDRVLSRAEPFAVGVVLLTATTALLTVLYHYSVPVRTAWRRDVPGALLAMGVWIAGSAGLRTYTTRTVEADAAYGPIAGPLALLLWLYVIGFGLLLGAELNAELAKRRAREAGQACKRSASGTD